MRYYVCAAYTTQRCRPLFFLPRALKRVAVISDRSSSPHVKKLIAVVNQDHYLANVSASTDGPSTFRGSDKDDDAETFSK